MGYGAVKSYGLEQNPWWRKEHERQQSATTPSRPQREPAPAHLSSSHKNGNGKPARKERRREREREVKQNQPTERARVLFSSFSYWRLDQGHITYLFIFQCMHSRIM